MTSPIERVGRSFADQAENVLREQILSGYRKPGDRLNEVEIASELGVSRGPVREAMQRLARDGLVLVKPHRGAFVRNLKPVEIRGLYEVRIALECTAARLAAERRTDADVTALNGLLGSSARAIAGNDAGGRSSHYPTPLDLHEVVALAAGNPRLHRLIVQINHELELVGGVLGYRSTRAPGALVEHTDVVQAIVDRDAERAGELMRAHLEESLENTLRLADASEDAGGE